MHEYVHVLQYIHEQDDDDDFFKPSPYEFFYMEVEAYKIVDEWWQALFNSRPPISANVNRDLPRGYKAKRKRYKELEEKVANFEELIVDEESDPPINEPKEMEELAEWFKKPENLPKIIGKNGFYDPDLDFDCDLDADISE
ncbi:MAG: hypothetical protein OXH84_00455 [Gammaproteobacteria bacterium]|nr:hypothetical protein [Gammaproteobacteria bacterium]